MKTELSSFLAALSTKEPIPGGGGASALIGAVSVALCSMVANLTTGKKRYAEYQADIDAILLRTAVSIPKLRTLIERDAEVFGPLAKAYGIPKDMPGRDEILEAALFTACSVPLEILRELAGVVDLLEQLSQKGSRLALSDVGVAAAACRAAMEGAIMNVYINTKLMKNRDCAARLNAEAETVVSGGVVRCLAVYEHITNELRVM